ncbi:MAG: hypothetical protein HY758_09630 [Nitrospirae bacterium]|nr:hypothetical protein [Nitrospirota bacterium]
MKILNIINNGQTALSGKVIEVQSKDHDVKVIDLSKKDKSYEAIVDEIFSNERVISW